MRFVVCFGARSVLIIITRSCVPPTDVFRALDPLRPVPSEVGGGLGMGSASSSRPSSGGMAAQRSHTPPDAIPPLKPQYVFWEGGFLVLQMVDGWLQPHPQAIGD